MDAKLDRFKTLAEPRLEMLYRVAWRLTGSRIDAEGLVRETCSSAWEELPSEADAAQVDRWLLSVLYHRFADGWPRKRRSPTTSNDVHGTMQTRRGATPGPDEPAMGDESQRVFNRAWFELEPMQRALLSLRAEGYGLVEIEAITGIRREVLRARLQGARASLARHLATTESAQDAASLAGRHR